MKEFVKKIIFWFIVGFFAILYIILMIFFTSRDYDVTNSLFIQGTVFGMVFEVMGPILMPFAGIYSIISILMNTEFRKKSLKDLTYILLGILYIYYFFIGSFTCKYSYLPILFVPAIVCYIAWTIGSVFINKYIQKKGLVKIHKKIVLVMFITVFASMVVCDIIKLIFGRFRYIRLTDESDFLPWYIVQSHEFNSSFPSGHAARSAIIFTLPLITNYFDKKSKFLSVCLYILCFVFVGLVCVSRLFEGMHYPTDILTGSAITCFSFFISKHIILKNSQ